jgi:hypothetical protein
MCIKGFKSPFANDLYITLAIAETFSNLVFYLQDSRPRELRFDYLGI